MAAPAAPLENEEEANRISGDMLSFLQATEKYQERLSAMLKRGETRLILDIADLRQTNPDLAKRITDAPADCYEPCNRAVRDMAGRDQPDAIKDKERDFYMGYTGPFGAHHVTPRGLHAGLLGSMVMVEGIVTKCSLVRPKVKKSVHYCQATNQFTSRVYRDATDLGGLPTSSVYPTKDENQNPLETEYGLSIYRDHQTLTIQEMPERAPAGQLPRSVEIILDDDLVDKGKPGDRVQITGMYRALAGRASGSSNGVFKTVVLANNVRQLGKEVKNIAISDADIRNIKKIGAQKNVFQLLAGSLAPSIYGHQYIKQALLLMLLGGMERNLESGTHIRGDINVLMVGDPSTAKSQLLRFVLNIAPLSISTTGRGSSGVGLTAAVVTDPDSGERRLEAGAMVLGDRGVVCIDEFDKMSDEDRVAIHEVMEQQTVTIAKAGIHTSLNARCSVVAAANPVYGQYNPQKKPMENIGLPDSLLSRFDLLFIVLDRLEKERDREIAEHVLRSHRFQGNEDLRLGSSRPTDVVEEEVQMQEADATPVFEKFDKLLHGGRRQNEIVNIAFIKKYIFYAKTRCKPVLDDEVGHFIGESWSSLRQKEQSRTLPVTARTLETLIRLATAHAKARLANTVTMKDAQVALELMNFALYHDAEVVPRGRKRRLEGGGESGDEGGDDDEDGGDDTGAGTKARPKSPTRPRPKSPTRPRSPTRSPAKKRDAGAKDAYAFEGDSPTPSLRKKARREAPPAPATAAEDEPMEEAAAAEEEQPVEEAPMEVEMSEERFHDFQTRLHKAFKKGAQEQPLEQVYATLNKGNSDPFLESEMEAGLRRMGAENKLMVTDGNVHLV